MKEFSKQIFPASVLIALATVLMMGLCIMVLYVMDDPRYAVLMLMLVAGIVGFSFVKEKMRYFGWALVFSISLRVVNANIGKRFPSLEIAYPNVNIFELLLVAGVMYFLLRWFFQGKPIDFPQTVENKIFVLLVSVFIISFFFITPVRDYGVQRTVVIVEMYMLYILTFNIWKTLKDADTIVQILLATVVMQVILVGLEIVLGEASPLQKFIAGGAVAQIGSEGVIAGRRISGSYGDAVVFGWVMAFLFLMLLPYGMVAANDGKKRRNLLLSLAALFGFGLLTMTRTALAAELFIAPLGIYLLARYHDRKLMRWIPRLFAVFLLFFSLIILLPGASDIITKRSSNADEIQGSLELRLASWDVGVRILSDFPLLGMGVGMGSLFSFSANRLDRYIQSDVEQERISYAGIHNGHAMMFAEMGVVGYGLYILFFGAFMKRAFALLRNSDSPTVKHTAVAAIMVSLYLLFSDFTGVSLAFNSAMWYVALMFGLISVAQREHRSSTGTQGAH